MGSSKYFLMGQQNRGTTNYRDFTEQTSAPSRPRSGIIRAWLDSLGILNFLASTGPAVKAILGIQADYNDAISKKHSNASDHTHSNSTALDAVSGSNTGDQELTQYSKAVQGTLSAGSHAGNPRGANATDFQFVREAVTRVASGAGSFIGGGEHNQISGANSMAAAGSHNEVSGQFCLVSGEHNEITGNHSNAFGDQHQVSGNKANASGSGHVVSAETAFAEGDGNIVSGISGHAEGTMNECTGDYSHAEGCNAKTYNIYQHAKASCGFSNPGEIGEAQYTNIIARGTTEDDSPIDLLVGEEQYVVLMNDKMNAFRIMVVAASDDNTEGAAYEIKGLIKKDATAASTALIGSISKTVIAESDADWDVIVAADTSNGALGITATGVAETIIRWVAFVEMIEVAFYGG
jgi:predicted nucleotidyltransferase